MRNVISVLVGCLGDLSEVSRQQLATIIRRELEEDMRAAGLSKVPTQREIDLADSGRKLDAVKLFKDRTGCGLIEAKKAIEAKMKYVTPSY